MIPRYNPHEFHDVLLEVEDISTNGQPYEEYAGELPSVELHTLNIPTWLKTLVRFGEDVNAATVYPSRSEALFDAVQGLIKHRIDDRTSMSLLLDPRYAISEKPREQGRKWLAGELARGHAKLNGHRRPPASLPETDPSPASGEEHRIAQEADLESRAEEERKPPRKSQATLLVELAGDAELWHTPEHDAYATIPLNGHREHWPLRVKALRRWLARLYYEHHHTTPGSQAIQDAIGVLEGKALFTGPGYAVWLCCKNRQRSGTRMIHCCPQITGDLTCAPHLLSNGATLRPR